jgi:hypothetical protein
LVFDVHHAHLPIGRRAPLQEFGEFRRVYSC